MLQDTINDNFVSLIPYSGIQFLDFGINICAHRSSPTYGKKLNGDEIELFCTREHEISGKIVDNTGAEVKEENQITVNIAKAFSTFDRAWLPLPLLRIKEKNRSGAVKLDRGPLNWARFRVSELEEPDAADNTHRITVVVDTNLLETYPNRPYAAPSEVDVTTGAHFLLAKTLSDLRFLVADKWGKSIIDDAFDGYLLEKYGPKRFESAKQNQDAFASLAFYVALIDLFNDIDLLPRLYFTDTVSTPAQYTPVNVDLAIDIGNSRTCGILIESDNNEVIDLNNSYSLELRDLSSAEKVYKQPFPSMIEFHREGFGNNRSTQRSRNDAFQWPTPARVGWEANRLFNTSKSSDGFTGMSSPKRYLWDTPGIRHDWYFNNFGSKGDKPTRTPAIRGTFFKHLSNSGDEWDKEDPDSACATRASYSRSSMMMFFIAEVISQALMLINAFSQRRKRSMKDLPRRLNRIVLTMPTAMALSERKLFEKRAQLALKTVVDVMKVPDNSIPSLVLKWDEATGTQAVFLYNEVKVNFRGDAGEFFEASQRDFDSSRSHRLRIASIDVGGGTTDLIVTTYNLTEGDLITPVQEIHEGFNIAGDDILRSVIERHILPVFQEYIIQCGVNEPEMLLATLFGESRANEDEREHLKRRLFSNQIFVPIGLRIIGLYEHYDVSYGSNVYTLKYTDVFDQNSAPSEAVLDYLNAGIEKFSGTPASFEEIEYQFDLESVDNTVTRQMSGVLGDLCELINHYSCDYVLLSGRPSMMPGVRNTVIAKLPVPIDRVVSMHNYKVGSWYPFRDLKGRLSDPKTTAAVGAMVCALSNGYLVGFSLRSDTLKLYSTANFIGKMDDTGHIKNKNLYFSNMNLDKAVEGRQSRENLYVSGEIVFSGPMFIGFRQMNIERWPGTLIYRLDFNDRSSAVRLKLPLKITLGLIPEEEDKDCKLFDVEMIEDAEGNAKPNSLVRFRLQTLRNDQGYWMDTGAFVIEA